MTVVDVDIHHLPEDPFSNPKMLIGFLNSAPRGFGEIARVVTMDGGTRQLVLEKPQGYQDNGRAACQILEEITDEGAPRPARG